MPLHQLISSGSLACLETALLQTIGEQKRGDPLRPVVVVCASSFLGNYLARRLVRAGMPHLGIRFLTLNELAQVLTQNLPADEKGVPLPGGGKELLIRRIMHELPDTAYFSQAEAHPHFAAMLAATFTDIEDSRIDLVSASAGAAEKMPGARRKLGELRQQYQRYRSELSAKGMLSEGGLLAQAGRGVERFAGRLGVNSLLAYGFYEHTGAQLEFLRRLAAHFDLTAFLLAEAGNRLSTSQPLREWWKALPAREQHLESPPPQDDLSELQLRLFAPPSTSPAKAMNGRAATGSPSRSVVARDGVEAKRGSLPSSSPVQGSLFPSAEPAPISPPVETKSPGRFDTATVQFAEGRAPDGTVQVISCPDEVAEAREIAREAIRLKREEGIDFTGMAVLAHDPAYLALLAAIFDRAEVPYYIREGLPLKEAPAGRSLLAALALPAREYARAEVMQWLTSGALDPCSLTPDGSEAPLALWDRLSAEAGLVAGEKQWRERLQAMLGGLTAELQKAGAERRPALEYRRKQIGNLLSFMEQLFAAGSEWQRCRTWTALADSVVAFLRRFHPPSRECEQVQEELVALGDLDRLGEPVDLLEFRAAGEAALGSSSRQLGTLEQSGVHLLSLTAARHTRFRVVFAPGLVEGKFPLPGRQDPVLLDDERRALSGPLSGNGATLPLKGSRPHEERLLFLLALGAARERLVLTVPRADAVSGAARMPSYYVLAVLECLAGRPLSYSDLNGAEVPRLRLVRRSHWLTQAARTSLDGREFDLRTVKTCLQSEHPETGRYLEHCSPNFARALEAEQAQWATPAFTSYEGMLVSAPCRQALEKLFSPDRVYAATALERYASCPYRFFLRDVLQLKELEDPASSDAIGAQDKGELMHAILSEFYAALQARNLLPLAGRHFAACREILVEISARRFEQAERDGVTGLPATWELTRKFILQDLESHLRAEIEAAENWLPMDFERSFGWDTAPIAVPAGEATLQLRGIIDRIDLDRGTGAVRVVDYKSGKKHHRLRVDLAGGQALQLPLYLLAAKALYPQAHLPDSVAEYLYLTRAGDWSRCVFSGSDLVEKQASLEEILETILTGCRQGIFPQCPEGNKAAGCGSCEYRTIGDPRREILWKRKQADPRLQAFRRMRELQ